VLTRANPRRAHALCVLQVLVQLSTRAAEKLLWAGAPIIRSRVVLIIFALWSFLLCLPAVLLVELVEDTGGWWALAWAVVSVFIFVPRISQGSRVVFALTSCRAFISVRTMYCSIETKELRYADVASLRIDVRPDATGEIFLRKKGDPHNLTQLRIYNIKGFRDACRVLEKMLPARVVEEAELEELLEDDQ